MDEQSVDYGNWVPKKMLIALFLLTLLFGAATLLLLHTIVRVLLGILAVATLLLLLYMYYSYRVFSANRGFFQKKIRGVVLENMARDGIGNALDIGTGARARSIFISGPVSCP